MKGDSKRYVDQVTQTVIALLHIEKLKPGSKLSVSPENQKIALRCRIASGRRETKNSHGFNIGRALLVYLFLDGQPVSKRVTVDGIFCYKQAT